MRVPDLRRRIPDTVAGAKHALKAILQINLIVVLGGKSI